MSITSIAITSQNNHSSGDILAYAKEFKTGYDDDDDVDSDLLNSILNLNEQPKDDNDNYTIIKKSKSNESVKECSIRHQFLLQSALDRMNNDIQFENRLRISYHRQFQGADYMWIGLICTLDEYRFYGYITNTNVKIIISVKDDISPEEEETQRLRDEEIKKIMVRSSVEIITLIGFSL